MSCYICGKNNLIKFLEFGHQPPSDAFLTQTELNNPEVTYPLNLYFCASCFLVQLGYAVDPKILFKDYVYTTGMNNSLKANFKELVDHAVQQFNLRKDDLVIDIGSNDGTLLSNYLPYGLKILGIDPSSASAIAINNGISTVVDFFNDQTATRVKKEYGQAKIITATNVFSHVRDLDSFMRGVAKLLCPNGIFISESHYLLDIIEKLQYDSVYHEHLRYYSLESLIKLFDKFGFEIFDVKRIASHNGSIRVFATQKGKRQVTQACKDLIMLERKSKINELKTMRIFAENVAAHRHKLQTMFLNFKKKGFKIVGIGAPAKGNTLLNYCHLGMDIVECLIEKSPFKIGLFSPGMHIPVVSEKKLFDNKFDYGIILSWNISEELIKKLRQGGFKGKFIIPFPKIRIC